MTMRATRPWRVPETVRELRRGQIVTAARAIVAQRGLEALTFAELEARLAFTRGVITYHFKDKDDLVVAVLESAVAELDADTFAEVAAQTSFEDKVRAALASKVHGFQARPEATRILVAFWARIPGDPRVGERNAALFRSWRAQATRLLALGGIADPETGGALLVGQVIGIVTQALFDPNAVDIDTLVEAAARSWRTGAPAHGPAGVFGTST